MPAPPILLVTRPQPEAAEWVSALRERHLSAEALPLIVIAPATPQPCDDEAPISPTHWHALMFVSGNAVQHFMTAPAFEADAAAFRASNTRAWAPGPGTARALRHCGIADERIDSPLPQSGQFDSESLWQVVHHQIRPGCRVRIVRGADTGQAVDSPRQGSGREWLADQLRRAGAEVDYLAVYERRPPADDVQLKARAAAAAHDGSCWLFSSSEAVRNLQQWLPDISWRHARALVTHPRIEAAARAAGFGVVSTTRPTLEDVAASIESLA